MSQEKLKYEPWLSKEKNDIIIIKQQHEKIKRMDENEYLAKVSSEGPELSWYFQIRLERKESLIHHILIIITYLFPWMWNHREWNAMIK